MDWSFLLMVSSALLWGSTDALIKKFAPPQLKRAKKVESGRIYGLVEDLFALLTCPGYLICQVVNQIGSLVYYYTLSLAPLSIVSPTVNTGKIIFNIIVGRICCGEEIKPRKLLGILLLMVGVSLQLQPWKSM